MALGLVGAIGGGCGNSSSKTRSMEQIYAEDGVPVQVEAIAPTEFSTSSEFHAVLSGVKESSAFAAVADKIDRINYEVGDFVVKDSPVLSFPTDNPSARYNQAQAAYQNAEATWERMRSYYESGGLSKQDLDNARTSYDVARADWDAVRQSVMVKAPISGLLTSVAVRESDNVDVEELLFTVSQVDRLKAKIWVSDREIADLAVGAEATATWNGIELQGSVVQVDLSMNQARQAFGAVVEFDNPDLRVKAGVTAEVSVVSGTNSGAVVVERKNVVTDGAGTHVFVVEQGAAVKRAVELGRSSGIDIEVVDGLSAGESLVTAGQMHLRDGSKVRVVGSDPAAAIN